MNLIEKAILEWSYRTKKGYPDLNNEEDLRVFESMFGFDPTITELVKLDYEVLTDRAKEIAQDLNTSRVVVSRLLKSIENNGKIELGRKKILVLEF